MTTPTIDSTPVAFTPSGAWTDWLPPIVAGCSEPRPEGAPDLGGFWQTIGFTARLPYLAPPPTDPAAVMAQPETD
ncbi:MAG: hypothetical protein GY698_18195 [Actinomycetia bacterium]|nr:hypothetical protein [Actinomycetes bacterium]